MVEPFCWITAAALRAIREEAEPADRKAARLLLLALAELAMDAYDGEHVGFRCTVADVMAAAELSENTYKKARRVLEKVGALRVEHPSPRSVRWVLLSPPRGSTVEGTRGSTIDPPRGRQESVEEEQQGSLLTEPPGVIRTAEDRIFEHWQKVMPGKEHCRLTPKRRTKIRARLRSFPEEVLIEVVDQAARDPFLNGDNDRGKPFNDFKTIFRDDEKIEELLEDARRPKPLPGTNGGRRSGNRGILDLARRASAGEFGE